MNFEYKLPMTSIAKSVSSLGDADRSSLSRYRPHLVNTEFSDLSVRPVNRFKSKSSGHVAW